MILLIIDHFTSLVSATLIPSEKAQDLKLGIISLTTPIRHPGPITIVTDSAPGLLSLAKTDKDLRDLHISVVLKDPFNKNYNAVVDRACQDIEQEIRKLAPEGHKISPSLLAKATISVNTMLRRKQGISAYELHTSRSQDTGSNLLLKDEDMYQEQIKIRNRQTSSIPPKDIRVGDTVTDIAPQSKHKSRDIYLVTGKEGDKISTQRLLHPLSDTPLKFMSREYLSNPKYLRVLHRPEISPPTSPESRYSLVHEHSLDSNQQRKSIHKAVVVPWSPINEKHFEEDSDDDEDDVCQEAAVRDVHRDVFPITPPPSNQVENVPVPVEEILDPEPEDESESLNLNLSQEQVPDFSVEAIAGSSVQDSVPDQSVDVTIESDLEVPQHIVDLANMADGLEIDPEQNAEEYVRQFSPDGQEDPQYQEHVLEPFHD